MASFTRIALVAYLLGVCTLAAPQAGNIPASISAEILTLLPTTVANPSQYLAHHPAALSSFENAISSIVVANPTYFPSAASALGAGGMGASSIVPSFASSVAQSVGAGGGAGGSAPALPASISAELATLLPSTVANPSAYLSNHPAAETSFALAVSSIIVANPTYFPSLYSQLRPTTGGAGGAGASGPIFGSSVATIPTTQILTSAQGASTHVVTQVTTKNPLLNPSGSGVGGIIGGQTTMAAQTTTAAGNYAAMQTPGFALGLGGAAVAAVAGFAALL